MTKATPPLDTTPPKPTMTRFYDLPTGGQLVLWTSRHWINGLANRRGLPACVWQSFAVAGLEDGFAALCRMMVGLSQDVGSAPCFATPTCRVVTDYEYSMLKMLAGIQELLNAKGMAGLAFQQSGLRGRVTEDAIRLARVFSTAGHQFLLGPSGDLGVCVPGQTGRWPDNHRLH